MRIYLESSALNDICSDNEREDLVTIMTTNHEPVTSSYTIVEVLCTKAPKRRRSLLTTLSKLSPFVLPLPQTIMHDFLVAFESGSPRVGFDEEYIPYLHNPELATDAVRNQAMELKQSIESPFVEIHKYGRTRLSEVLQSKPASLGTFVRTLGASEAAQDVIRSMMKKVGYSGPLLERIPDMLQNLEPWRYYLGAQVHAIYHRGFSVHHGNKGNPPGSIDTKQVLYLVAADAFVTSDKPNYKMVRYVERLGHSRRKVWTFKQFKDFLRITDNL